MLQVFNEYLQDLSAFYTSATGQRVACCGDTAVKIIHRTGVDLEVHLEVELDRKPMVGEYLDKVLPPPVPFPLASPCLPLSAFPPSLAPPSPHPLSFFASLPASLDSLHYLPPPALPGGVG